MGFAIFLDSNAQHSSGRFDLITAAPVALLADPQHCHQWAQLSADLPADLSGPLSFEAAAPELIAADINAINTDARAHTLLGDALQRYTSTGASHSQAPFVSGVIGVCSYDFGMRLNSLTPHHRSQHAAEHRWPELYLGIYQWAIVQDHQQQQAWLLADPKQADKTTQALLSLVTTSRHSTTSSLAPLRCLAPWQSSASQSQYAELFYRAIDYIRQGDCYQINLAQQMSAPYSGDSWLAYQQLRDISPTPFAAYIELPQQQLLSLSPERFIRVVDRQVTTQPIKGTRKRSMSRQEDIKLVAELSDSAKDRAENLMIVDLMRNDLGKCCEQGSIDVPVLFQIESHPNVHHMVSTVTGTLPEHTDQPAVYSVLELLASALPGGSVTGAPKKRAMEIIDELESFNRSIYCGSVVYINNDGNMDSSILIRSLLCEQDSAANSERDALRCGTIRCWGGGGIVADSKAELEYEESLQKIRNLLQALAID